VPWLPIGYQVIGPNSREVSVGRMAGELLDGCLHLRIAYRGSAVPDPLSFFIVDFLDDDGIRSVESVKFWPKREPAACRLGPCPETEVAGRVMMRARSLNRRRLLSGYPVPAAPFLVEAYLPAGSTFPRFTPAGVRLGDDLLELVGDAVGPGGAFRLGVRGA